MATKNRPAVQGKPARRGAAPVKRDRTKLYLGGAGVVVVLLVGLMAFSAIVLGLGNDGKASNTSGQTSVHIAQGDYTNVTADRLADMLKNKDFTFVNVKTPYIGEIDDTDLYIPYDQLAARATELPADKSAKIVVYCRSGNESAIASQTLLQLGYTNIENLDGGMNAWQASGRSIVQKNRT